MKRYFLHTSSCLTGASLLFLGVLLPISQAVANPVGGDVVRGDASISQSGNTLDIHQSSQKAVIDWRGFDIKAGEKTQFHQPNSSAIVLNRVSGPASQIDGMLKANGNVMVVNPNGVVFGAGAQVDVNSLVATTADIDNDRFMNGDLRFDKPGNPDARIVNQGTITAREAGLVGLVAPSVLNDGVINAKLGRVQLASGDTVTVDLYGNGLMEVEVSDAVQAQLVDNSGAINAAGGTIALTAAAAKNIVNGLVTVKGELNAPTVGVRDGKIIISAAGSNAVEGNAAADKGLKQGESTVVVQARLDASGYAAGEKGGDVTITGDTVAVLDGTEIDASGATGGGNIKIGGAYQGKGETAAAKQTIVESGATLKANATQAGDGGEVIVWSDDATAFAGKIEAKGGAESGDGGFAEVSGKHWLDFRGMANLYADKGELGTLLLDPTNITITTADSAPPLTWSGGVFSDASNRDSATIAASTIVSQLDLANVTITTASSGGLSGHIRVQTPIEWTGVGSLTLRADGNIEVGGKDGLSAIGDIIYSGNNDVALNLVADGYVAMYDGSSIYVDTAGGATGKMDVTLNSSYGAGGGDGGAIRIEAGSDIITNGGFIVMGGGLDPWTEPTKGDGAYFSGIRITGTGGAQVILDASSDDRDGGDIMMNGAAYNTDPAAPNRGIYYQYTTMRTNGAGDVTLNGDAYSGTNIYNEGINLTDSTVEVENGSVLLNGNGAAGSQYTSGLHLVRTSVASTASAATAGTITLQGTGGAASSTSIATDNSQSGVLVDTGSSISSGYADIIIDGIGGTGTGVNARGVVVAGVVESTGSGNDAADISITGQGGSGTAASHEGVMIQGIAAGTRISSVDGDILIEGTAGTNSSDRNGILFQSDAATSSTVESTGDGNVTLRGLAPALVDGIETAGAGSYAVGNAAGTGAVSFITDFIGTLSGLAVQNGGDVIFRPYSNGGAVNIGAASGGASLNLTDSILGNIASYAVLWLGGDSGWNHSGTVSIDSNAVYNGDVNFMSGGDMLLANGTLQKDGGAASVDWNFLANGNISTSGGAGTDVTSGSVDILLNSGYDGSSGTSVSFGAGSVFDHDGTLTFITDNLSTGEAFTGEVTWLTDAANPTGNFADGSGTLIFNQITDANTLSIGSGTGYDITLSNATAAELAGSFAEVRIGKAAGGSIINRNAAWDSDVTFLTGGNFINAVNTVATGDFTVLADGDITLGNTITANGSGANALVLSAGDDFINQAGAAALSTPFSRWLVYSGGPSGNSRDGLLPDAVEFGKTYTADAPNTIAGADNRFLYATGTRPSLTLRVDNDSVAYNQPYSGGSYSYVSGLAGDDTMSNIALTGSPIYSTTYTAGDSAGVKTGALTATVNTLATVLGYDITINAGNLTVIAADAGAGQGNIPDSAAALPDTVAMSLQDPYVAPATMDRTGNDPEQSLVKWGEKRAFILNESQHQQSFGKQFLGGLLVFFPSRD